MPTTVVTLDRVTIERIHRDIEQQTKQLKAIAQELKRANELKVKELVDAGILAPGLPQLQTETRPDVSE